MNDSKSYARLRKLFQTVVSVSMVSGAGGCASGVNPAEFETDLCAPGGMYQPLAGVTLATPADYVSLRSENDFATAGTAPNVIAETGTACATATDLAACQSQLSALRSAIGWNQDAGGGGDMIRSHRYIAFTRGNEVGLITTTAELAAFVAPVDTAGDAALLATERGYRLACGSNNVRMTATGFELRVRSGTNCGANTGVDEHRVAVSASGEITVLETVRIENGNPNCAIGRRPEGLVLERASDSQSLGGYFAEIAELEAASIAAFKRLARELRALGAPEALARAAERSAQDEVRHAAVTSRIAARHGGSPRTVTAGPLAERSLFEVALENAVEGCVRETFGALQAMHQARHASDRRIAAAMRVIAEDETRHAALAWDIAAWMDSRLTAEQRAEIARARADAASALFHDLGADPPAPAVARAGAPSASDARRMHQMVAPQLWAA